jgi:Biopolymer transport protein
MSRFRKTSRREVPILNTASLPDLIFTILFFFVIVTNMRPVPIKTQFDVPQASELQKLQEKNLVVYVMVGKVMTSPAKQLEPVIQLDSDFVSLENLPQRLEERVAKVSEADRNNMTVVMKIDKDTPMGLVNDIKLQLRQHGLLSIHYSVERMVKA